MARLHYVESVVAIERNSPTTAHRQCDSTQGLHPIIILHSIGGDMSQALFSPDDRRANARNVRSVIGYL